ncbi:MAG: tyrosine-type recombinase/integrase [Acidimicrobiia bacterium]
MSVHLRWTKEGARRYDVRLRDPTGKTYTRTFRTRREAEAFESDERASRRRGNWLDPRRSEEPLRTVADRWLDSNPAKRPSSRARDDSALRVHILPGLGDRSIGSLTPSDIQRCVNYWSESLAPRSVRRMYQTLSAVLNAAVLDDRIARSPCRGIRLPAIQPTDRPVLTADQLADLAQAMGPQYATMVYLGAVLGLRWGECAGLRVGRIDFDRSTITIAEQVTRGIGGRSVIGPPKSQAARRTLAAPSVLMELLANHLELRRLTTRDGDAFLVATPDREHLDYSNWLHRVWYPARQRAQVEWAQFHDLRRANATGLVLEGIDLKTAQTRLGHTDPRLTLGIYAQATTEADRQAAERLGDRFLPRQNRERGRGRGL